MGVRVPPPAHYCKPSARKVGGLLFKADTLKIQQAQATIATHMNIALNQSDSANATLTVSLSEQDYSEKLNNKIKDFSKKAQLKGFRPGKVPPALIQKMYGKSLLVEQINEMLSETVNNYIRENNLRILGEPLPNRDSENQRIDWDNQREFEFSYELGLVPDFKVDLNDVTVEGIEVTIDDATMDETYAYIQKQNGKMINPEVSEKGDFLYGELKQLETDFSTKTLLPLNQIKEGEEKFIGVKPGDILFFDIRKTFGYDDSAIAHVTGLKKELAKELQGEFEFVIERINRTEPAELNQELFDKMFGPGNVSSELEFRDKVAQTVKENYDREAKNVLYSRTIQAVINHNGIELPIEFLRRWMLATDEKLTEEKVDEQMDDQLNALRWNLVKNEIAEKNEIKVSGEEVVEVAKGRIRQQFGMMEVSEELEETLNSYANQMLQQDNGKQFRQEYDNLLTEKVLDHILGQIKVENKQVTATEFRNMTF